MPFSTTIPLADRRSRVGPVDRRSGSLPDILDELLRIAQQADAYEIHVETFDYERRPILSVYDNARGSRVRETCSHWMRSGGADPSRIPEMVTG